MLKTTDPKKRNKAVYDIEEAYDILKENVQLRQNKSYLKGKGNES